VTSELLTDVLGIVSVTVALLVYGVLQERIMTIGFGTRNPELFENSIFLVLCNRLCTCVIACAFIAWTQPDVTPAAPIHSYAYVSFTNVVATSCQYEALKYVSFAVQTLAKSAKTLPVMIWGTVFTGKRYKASDYLHALTITAGCSIFLLTGDVSSRAQEDRTDTWMYVAGGLFMLLYLAVDGLTSTWQDSLFHSYNMGICDQVLFTTAFSTALSFVAAVATGQLIPSIAFVMRHPEAMWWILGLSMASAAVQLVISFTIKRFGAVVFATVMTTRQFFSVLLSSVVFWTPLTSGQWIGMAIVFGALYYRVFSNKGGARQLRSSKSGKGSPASQHHGHHHAPHLAPLLGPENKVPSFSHQHSGSLDLSHKV